MAILERNDRNHIAQLLLNTPETLNALSDDMLTALQTSLDDIASDDNIRAVVISGAGKAFCAGHNLKEMTAARQSPDQGRAYFKDLFDRCARMMMTIQKIPQPVIAQVHGIATAAGCQLVASCDMAVAAEGTRFGVNGVNIGLFCSTPMVALSRNIPRKKAFEMLTTGGFIEAVEAERLGLINHAVPHEDLEKKTQDLAQTIVQKLTAAVKIGKQAFYDQSEMPIDQAYVYTGDIMVENMMLRDTEEGINAFIEKRDPDWKT
ncbi:enoyl-CoA hydratase [Parasulfitobacter algicola]|uniref:Enoyl-CoA hydratase domain-containing protein 3, mitochondrial n=1 Tax=Parasulfitobacter algicola TaxID=2614809 RepID=A0ABX2IYF3_9RHOB|nr:enoyl-CoA hydratase [Sulfitobacter algicola]NSX55626.1 enoyl-CoA hydratase [Sulfitobacter algicola]